MCTFKNEQTVMLCDVALSTGYASACKNPSVRQFSTPWLRGKERSFRRDRQSIRRDFRRWLTRLLQLCRPHRKRLKKPLEVLNALLHQNRLSGVSW